MRLSSRLYKAARVARTTEAVGRSVETGDPSYAGRRVRNILVGRALGKIGFWRALWGGGRRS
jgi:hypothetical protein